MTCGIKLEWDDYHLEWNLDAYLEQMKQKLQRQLEEIGTEGRGQEQNQHQNQSQKNRSSAQQETSA
jgi:hypothetical protein